MLNSNSHKDNALIVAVCLIVVASIVFDYSVQFARLLWCGIYASIVMLCKWTSPNHIPQWTETYVTDDSTANTLSITTVMAHASVKPVASQPVVETESITSQIPNTIRELRQYVKSLGAHGYGKWTKQQCLNYIGSC